MTIKHRYGEPNTKSGNNHTNSGVYFGYSADVSSTRTRPDNNTPGNKCRGPGTQIFRLLDIRLTAQADRRVSCAAGWNGNLSAKAGRRSVSQLARAS